MDFYVVDESFEVVEVRHLEPSDVFGDSYRHYHTDAALRAEVLA